MTTSYETQDDPKMLRETLCVAQSAIANSLSDEGRKGEHIMRLQRLIDACDSHRPLGPDGKHGDRHALTCGCDGVDTVSSPDDELDFRSDTDPHAGYLDEPGNASNREAPHA